MRTKKWISESGTRTYYAWRSMRMRCLNPNTSAFKNYGGRGITVCDKWLNDFDAFHADMGLVPVGFSLDRVDNNNGYSPENCRWATDKEQHNNKRNNVAIEHEGIKLNMSQWAERLGLNKDTLWRRLNVLGMPAVRALTPGSLQRPWLHGTRHGYEQGCRCDECKAAHAARHRAMRAKRKARLDLPVTESAPASAVPI